jgi:pterin-4a-carbinolamine dehydratase
VGWELKDGKIVGSFQFPSLIKAIEFINEIAKVAEI